MTETLAAALVLAQREARAVERTSRNEHHGYDYASADDVITACKAALALGGLAFHPKSAELIAWPFPELKIPDVVQPHVAIRVLYELVHGASGERDECSSTPTPVLPGKGKPWDRAIFGARTLDLGYALRDVLLLPRVTLILPRETTDERDERKGDKPARREVAPPKSGATNVLEQARAEERDRLKAARDTRVAELEQQLGRDKCVEAAQSVGHEWPPRSSQRALKAFEACEKALFEASKTEAPDP